MSGKINPFLPTLIAVVIALALFMTESTLRILSPLSSPWMVGTWVHSLTSRSLSWGVLYTGDSFSLLWRIGVSVALYLVVIPVGAVALMRRLKQPRLQAIARTLVAVIALMGGAYAWKGATDAWTAWRSTSDLPAAHELNLMALQVAVSLSAKTVDCACLDELASPSPTSDIGFSLIRESDTEAVLEAVRLDGGGEPVRYRITVRGGVPVRADLR